jgi:hypothetical protein
VPRVSSDGLAAGLLAVAAAVLACLAPAQSDTWWLLRAGRDIVSSQAIPLVDAWSWTASGMFWPNHEGLTELVFYLVHAAAGMPGLALVSAVMIVAALAISWRLAEGAFELRFVGFGLALVASTSVFAIRPQVFTIAAFSLTCWLLRHDRVWFVPALIAVWVNFHGAAVLGVIAVAAALVSDVVSMRKHDAHGGHGEHGEQGGRTIWGLAAVTLVSLLATLASPLGTRLWTFIPESTRRSSINRLVEWSAPDLAAQHWPFWAAAAALVALTLWRWRQLDPNRRRLVAIAVAMLPLAVQSMRNIPVFLLAAVPALTMLASARAVPRASPGVVRQTDQTRPRRGENERLNGAILTGLAALAAVAVVLIWMRPPPMLQWRPVSPAAARAIATCGAPLFNTYARGGELIWFVPTQKVFIDNRQDPYPPDLLAASRKLEHDGDYRGLFDRYGVQCAAIPPDSIVARELRSPDGWTLAYEDGQWAVFTRPGRR